MDRRPVRSNQHQYRAPRSGRAQPRQEVDPQTIGPQAQLIRGLRRTDTVQEVLRRDPHAGDLYVFRGKRGDLLKILWHDGLGMSLYAKRLERGKFIWPSPVDGAVAISAAQLSYMLEGIDWRNPQRTWRPELAG